MRSAEEELRRRRERGKQSQARFRKKQAQETQEMRHENERLKVAIADIVSAATRQSDNYGLLKTILNAASAAGIDTTTLEKITFEDDEAGESVTRDKPSIVKTFTKLLLESFEPRHRKEQPTVDTSSSTPLQASITKKGSHISTTKIHKPLWRSCSDTSATTSTASPSSSPRSTYFNPRLDYGIWIDASRAIQIVKPPPGIVPFLGAGQYTFSGQLYWACVDYVISLCRAVTTPQPLASWHANLSRDCQSANEAEQRLWQVLQHTPPVTSVRLALALAEAQVEFRDNGYIYGDSPVSDIQTGTRLREEIEAAYVASGRDLSIWIDVAQLERHLRQQLGSQAFSCLERALATQNMTPFSPTDEARMVAKLLIKNLAESYICFGDGPRWKFDCLSKLSIENMVT